MIFADKQRQTHHDIHGAPALLLEFEVFADGAVSMWTHLDHSMPFEVAERYFLAIQEHLASFLQDRKLCPMCPAGEVQV